MPGPTNPPGDTGHDPLPDDLAGENERLRAENAQLRADNAQLRADNAGLSTRVDQARDQEMFLSSIVENIPDMIFVKDAGELRFVQFNAAGEALLGYPRSALLGKNDRDLFPPVEAEFFIAKDREVLDRGALLDIPEEPIHTVAGLRWLHTKKIPLLAPSGRPLYLLGISEDITERKLAEAALAESTTQLTRALGELTRTEGELRDREQRLRILLEHLPGAMWTTDRWLHLTSIAGAHAARLGLAGDEVIGEPIDTRLPPAGPGADVVEAHRAAARGEPATYEFHAQGQTYEVRVEQLPGESEGVVAIALDVTERRRVEAERLRARLERAQKLELLGLLAGGIAHDFNNLLTVILGNASLALLRLGEADPAATPVRRIEQSAHVAADLTRQLLAYSGKGRFVVEAVDLSEVVNEIASLLRVTISKKITLKFDLARELPRCEADIAQLRQVLVNLLTNASDAIGDAPGSITLATGNVWADRAYLGNAWLDEDLPEGPYVWVEVSDTGVGMTPDQQNHMFDPFFSTKPKGHGLGLAATLGIVRGHRGAIRVYSEPGRGTTIKVMFPALGSAERRDSTRPGLSTATRGTVLVVDDEEAIRVFATDVLEGAGFRVVTACDGVEAVDRFRTRQAEIAAVLLDMTMPRMNGEETFRELRRLQPSVRVLLSSGYNEQDTTNRFAGKGLAGFLQKPYTARDLIERVEQLLS